MPSLISFSKLLNIAMFCNVQFRLYAKNAVMAALLIAFS
jgi:hypothetical protein